MLPAPPAKSLALPAGLAGFLLPGNSRPSPESLAGRSIAPQRRLKPVSSCGAKLAVAAPDTEAAICKIRAFIEAQGSSRFEEDDQWCRIGSGHGGPTSGIAAPPKHVNPT